MDNHTNLVLLFNRTGRNGHATITAKCGDEVLALEKVDLTSSADRMKFAKRVCRGRKGICHKEIEVEIIKQANAILNPPAEESTDSAERTDFDSAELLAQMPQQVRDNANELLKDPRLFQRCVEDITALGVAGESTLVAAIYLAGTSRTLERPLSTIVQGPTSSGKSYLIEQTARLFPPEAVIHATRMTPQALFHMPSGSLKHKFIVAGERSRLENDETAEATRALREMISAGKLSKLMPVKEQGTIVTRLVEQEGPISYVESTSLTAIFEEDANRCIVLTTDERDEQTRNIVTSLGNRYAGNITQRDSNDIIERHHAIQRTLEPSSVVIPFAPRLADLFASDRVEARRAFPQLMSMIQASAVLHQRQRSRDNDGNLLAARDDYRIARELLAMPFARSLGGGLSEPAIRFLERLTKVFSSDFSSTDAKSQGKGCERSVRDWLGQLLEVTAIDLVEPSRGPRPAIWRLNGTSADSFREKSGPLPTIDKVFD